MDKIPLLEILQTKPFLFTYREIEKIIDEELSRTSDDMDAALIDICVDILDREHSKDSAEENLIIATTFKIKGVSVP